jgi:dipeptidyl-peptidase-4
MMSRVNVAERLRVCGVIVCLLASVGGGAAAQGRTDEMLRRIFASRDFASDRFGPARWLGDSAYTTVEASATVADAAEIVRYDAASGQRTVLIAANQLVPAGGGAPLDIEDYAWSKDGSKLLIFTNSEKVWRDNTRGDYWVLDRAAGTLKKLGGAEAKPATLMFAKFSPDGSRVGYVREGDLYVETLSSGQIARLTNDGSRTRVNGTTDWVYEEEFGLRDAFRFSPDGNRVAYWQFDMTGVRDFLLVNDTDSLYSFTVAVQYPKAGTTNSAVRAGVVGVNGGATTWLQLPGDARNDYLPRMEWAESSNELILQRMNRLQNTNRIMIADGSTGAVREIMVERDSAWLDVVNDLTWLSKGTRFLWVSERDGWRHLYTVSRDGKQVKLITPGNYDVVDVENVDEAGGYVHFTASPDNATQRYLYRVPIAGGRAERVTPANLKGTHSYLLSAGAKRAIHFASGIDTPTTVDLVDLPKHIVTRTLLTNDRLRANVAQVVTKPTEFFQVNVGNGVMLDGWMVFPRDFDPAKKYPLLMYVYSEPAAQTVLDAWGGQGMMWHRMLADQGYIVASVDNRGTPAPRGRAWRKVVYGAIGVLSSREQAEAVKELGRQRNYIDLARVGVWGWSGGGSATLNALFRYPDVYHMGMAVAPVPEQDLYDTIYQERYMGLPQENAEGYKNGSPITFASGLRGDLLHVHGSGDDNVHYQGTERLVNDLVKQGKMFDLMVYPNRTHCICEGQGTTLHVYSLLTRYLVDHLPAGGK